MNDYKELIAQLNGACFVKMIDGDMPKADLFARAADAIEQLAKERDAATDCIYAVQDSLYRVGGNDYAEGIIEQWEKEREDNT